jgi:hypothetical protein
MISNQKILHSSFNSTIPKGLLRKHMHRVVSQHVMCSASGWPCRTELDSAARQENFPTDRQRDWEGKVGNAESCLGEASSVNSEGLWKILPGCCSLLRSSSPWQGWLTRSILVATWLMHVGQCSHVWSSLVTEWKDLHGIDFQGIISTRYNV